MATVVAAAVAVLQRRGGDADDIESDNTKNQFKIKIAQVTPNATEALSAPGHVSGHKLCSFILPSGTDGDNTTGLSCNTPEVLPQNAGDWDKTPNSCCSQLWRQELQ